MALTVGSALFLFNTKHYLNRKALLTNLSGIHDDVVSQQMVVLQWLFPCFPLRLFWTKHLGHSHRGVSARNDTIVDWLLQGITWFHGIMILIIFP